MSDIGRLHRSYKEQKRTSNSCLVDTHRPPCLPFIPRTSGKRCTAHKAYIVLPSFLTVLTYNSLYQKISNRAEQLRLHLLNRKAPPSLSHFLRSSAPSDHSVMLLYNLLQLIRQINTITKSFCTGVLQINEHHQINKLFSCIKKIMFV